MKPANALYLYRVRLRARFVQELFAVAGIAAGVALLFASQVSSSSLQNSVAGLSRGIAGEATLQLTARDPHGFPQALLAQVRQLSGVRIAAPLLEGGANLSGPRGSESVELVGAEESLSALGGKLVRHLALEPFGDFGAVVLPAPLARRIGVSRFGQEMTFQIAGRSTGAPLYEQLSARQIGGLSWSPVALVPLFYAQQLTGLAGRVSRIFVVPKTGREAQVRAGLERLAAGRLNVEPVSYDQTLFAKAAAASNQSTLLFAVVSALVGFLFAFNAMLLTVPQRRRLVADLRRDGYRPRTVIGVLLLDAFALGLLACVLGLALGEELSIHVLHSHPAFLSLAFAIGAERIVTWQSIAIATGGGMLAAIVAVLSPLLDILSRDPLAAINPPRDCDGVTDKGAGGRAALAGLACLGAATAILRAAPDAAIPGMILLLAALLLVLPSMLSMALKLAGYLARTITSVVPHVAVMELRSARARAVAITATAAIAVFGSVAIQGAHGDLLAGLEGATRELNASADVWVAPAGAYDLLDTTPFPAIKQAQLERLPGTRAVRPYRSALLDYGQRRVLVIAPPRQATQLLPTGQIVQGDPSRAVERLRAGGWLVLSRALAAEQHLHVGQAFRLPSPEPMSFRIAALSTNLGWAPGAIVMNASDYASAWGSTDISAYNVLLAPGLAPARAVGAIERALGPSSGLTVQSAAQHADRQVALSRQALTRLGQIATLILIVAILATAAAIGAMVWQRRPRLAKLKLEGVPHAQLWHTILVESLILLVTGCLSGAVFGVYGQQLADRALAETINFPVAYSLTPLIALWSVTSVIAVALAILAIPGYLAASVPAALALQD
jgi:putative ABC transport system permease protein